jgi:hypothetical protein
MDDGSPKRRRREPRIRDNPMARIAHEVMVEAERAYRRADALAAGMEPHLLKRVNDSAIYGYTNDRPDRNVPPGDVLLAAALAAGISLDRKVGVARGARNAEMEDLRAQIADMRDEMAQLRAEVIGRNGAPSERPAGDRNSAIMRAERATQRRAWAQRSEAGGPPAQATPTPRHGSRRPGL